MQTSTAAVHLLRSTFSLSKIFPATALVTSVSEAEAGATRLRFRWFKANNSEKKARARKLTPAKKSGQVSTARIAPLMPARARISSRSPSDFMGAAVSPPPAVEQRTTQAIMVAADHGLTCAAWEAKFIAPVPQPLLPRSQFHWPRIVAPASNFQLHAPQCPVSQSTMDLARQSLHPA